MNIASATGARMRTASRAGSAARGFQASPRQPCPKHAPQCPARDRATGAKGTTSLVRPREIRCSDPDRRSCRNAMALRGQANRHRRAGSRWNCDADRQRRFVLQEARGSRRGSPGARGSRCRGPPHRTHPDVPGEKCRPDFTIFPGNPAPPAAHAALFAHPRRCRETP